MVVVDKLVIHTLADLELNRVVCGRDRVEVPLDEAIALHLLDVLYRNYREEVDEDGEAGDVEPGNLARLYVLFGHEAGSLEEKVGVLVAGVLDVAALHAGVERQRIEDDRALVALVAAVHDSLLHSLLVHYEFCAIHNLWVVPH